MVLRCFTKAILFKLQNILKCGFDFQILNVKAAYTLFLQLFLVNLIIYCGIFVFKLLVLK